MIINIKKYIQPLLVGLFLLTLISLPGVSLAQDSSTNVSLSVDPSSINEEGRQALINQLLQIIAQLQSQIVALQEKLKSMGGGSTPPTITPGNSFCPQLTRNLYLGLKDGDTNNEVSSLQKFLAQDRTIYPEAIISGFFGPLTEQALQRWQARQGIVSSGSTETTGYGLLGPGTRLGIQKHCGGLIIPPIQPPLPPEPPISNQAPVISGVKGPTTLKINEVGTWSVSASDPKNGNLSYQVVWGDEIYGRPFESLAPANAPFQQTATFSHSYNRVGVFYPTFTVTNSQGQTAKTSISVQVSDKINPLITVIVPNGGETWTTETTQTIKWRDNTPYPKFPCVEGVPCPSPLPKYYSINLNPYYPRCTDDVCLSAATLPYTIAKNVSGSSYNWSVGKYLDINRIRGGVVPDGLYIIEVCQINSSICDSSDSYFKIYSDTTQSSITVLSPNGGEMFTLGKTIPITWKTSQPGVGSVSIYLKDEDNGKEFVLEDNAPNKGYYEAKTDEVSVPGIVADRAYRVSIWWDITTNFAHNRNANDVSDSYFKIYSDTTQSPITVLSPNGGEILTKGTEQTIKWVDIPPLYSPCIEGKPCPSPLPKYYDINLIQYTFPCTGNVCPAAAPLLYTIAKNVSGPSYNWLVGKYLDIIGTGTGGFVPEGSYTIKVCQINSSICDSSDSYFKIYSDTTSIF